MHRRPLTRVVGNVRFLILRSVEVANLVSHVLGFGHPAPSRRLAGPLWDAATAIKIRACLAASGQSGGFRSDLILASLSGLV
jgi:hypothetical protein